MSVKHLKEWVDFANSYAEGGFWNANGAADGGTAYAGSPFVSDSGPSEDGVPLPIEGDDAFVSPIPLEWKPAVDIVRTDTELWVVAELPGVRREELQLSVSGIELTIRGMREAWLPSGSSVESVVRECGAGSFERTVSLPVSPLPGAMAARLTDGLLIVRLRCASAAPVDIPVW